MDIKYFKSGDYTTQYGYMSFSPNPIDGEWNINIPEINVLLEEANIKLAELNAFSKFVPEAAIFLDMFILKEALHSCRIDGNNLTIEEAVLGEKDISAEQIKDWKSVKHYIEGINYSINKLETQALSPKLLKELHKILLKGTKTRTKSLGEFRTSHCWVGGEHIKDAVFVPPHHELVDECINDVFKFLHNKEIKVPRLIRIGIAYYQFKAIHAFLEGNGGVGRILIMCYLKDQQLLNSPFLYLSDYFEKNKLQYYENLLAVSLNNKLEQWLNFFLTSIIETASNAIENLIHIKDLNDRLESSLALSLGKRLPNAKALLIYLYSKPIVSVADVMIDMGVSKQTANVLIADFFELGILKEQTGGKRNRVFVFEEYFKLLRC